MNPRRAGSVDAMPFQTLLQQKNETPRRGLELEADDA
jgi:hypothetical protein